MNLKYKLRSVKNNIKWKFQRAKRGFSDADTWDVDFWFLTTMKSMLQRFIDNTHSFPIAFTEEEWKAYVSRMIYLLDEMDEDTCSYKNPYEEEFQRFCERFVNTEDREKTPEEQKMIDMYLGEEENKFIYRNNCKKEFFEMFSKVFWDLWD